MRSTKQRVVVLGAGYSGLVAAKRIARQVRRDEVDVTLVSDVGPFRFRYLHECVGLGRKHGLVQFLRADERPKEQILTCHRRNQSDRMEQADEVRPRRGHPR